MGEMLVAEAMLAAVNLDGQHLASLIAAVFFGIVGVLGALGKLGFKRGEQKTTEVTRAGALLDVANGTVAMVSKALREELARISAQLAEEREIHAREQAELRAQHAEQMAVERKSGQAIRRELAEANREVRGLRKELRQAWAEAERLRDKYEHPTV